MNKTFYQSLKSFFGFESEESLYEKKEASPPLNNLNKNTSSKFNQQTQIKQQNLLQLFEIKVEEPRIYEDSLNIASELRSNTPVILNLKYLDKETSKRLIDFICGTAYAINGHMMKIGENIFLFTPAQVNIINNERPQEKNNEVEHNNNTVFFTKEANN